MSKVLSRFAGREITDEDLKRIMSSIPQESRRNFSTKEGKKRLLDEIIVRELMFLDAKEKGYDKEDAYLNHVEEAKKEILTQYTVNKLLSTIKIDEEELKSYYDTNKGQFSNPPEVKASHILLKDKDLANDVLKKVQDGMDFVEAAKEYSECPSEQTGGDLGFFSRGKMVQEFEDVAFAMEVGQVSDVVQTQFGYHIIKLTDKKDSSEKPFDEVKPQIQQMLLRKKQQEKYVSVGQELKKDVEIEIFEDAIE